MGQPREFGIGAGRIGDDEIDILSQGILQHPRAGPGPDVRLR